MIRSIYIILLSAFALLSVPLSAQTARQMLLTMPDSIVPYLSKDTRTELQTNDSATVAAFTDVVKLDSVADDFLSLRLSQSSKLELMKLPRTGGSDLWCMVRTYAGPAEESTVDIVDTAWSTLSAQFLPHVEPADLELKPDTMSADEYNSTKRLLYMLMVEVKVSPTDKSLTFGLSLPLTDKASRAKLQTILCNRKFTWNGTSFQ